MDSHSLLIMDADQSVHERLTHILNRPDRTIRIACDGGQALDLVRESVVDLVVAGRTADGLDAITLLDRIQATRPRTKVILIGEQDRTRALEALRHRAFSYFHQPLAEGPLADMADCALQSDSWQRDVRVVSARQNWVELEVRSRLYAVERTVHYVRELLSDLPARACEDTAAAFRELLLNAIEHGGKSDPRTRARVALVRAGRSLIVRIQDPGSGFTLDVLPNAAVSNPADAPIHHAEVREEQGQRPGGFGILITRNMVDELVYNERGNEVLFVKYLA